MTTTTKTAAAKTAKTTSVNGWTEETTALAITLYKEAFAVGGAELANDPSSTLKEIQEKTGAKSVVSVRSKLISEKVYEKADAPRKVGGGSSVRKVHFVRALAAKALAEGVIDDIAAFDSLEQAKAEPLKALAKLLNVEVTA